MGAAPADNSEVERTPVPIPAPSGSRHDDVDREPYRRRLLVALDNGVLAVPEYARRLQAVNAAGSGEVLDALVADLGPGPTSAPAAVGDMGIGAGRGLDPVDLALMERGGRAPSGQGRSRYLGLVVMLVFFVVLLAVGVYLASHVHSIGSGAAPVLSGVVMAASGGLGARGSRG